MSLHLNEAAPPPRPFPVVWFGAVLLACVAGCSSDAGLGSTVAPSDVEAAVREVALTANVFPTDLVPDEGAAYRALPQTFFPEGPFYDSGPASLGDLTLLTPVVQRGTLSAYRVNPLVAQLPGEDLAVLGTVRLWQPGSVQSYAATTDEEGTFDVAAVPGVGYRLQIVPDDPLVPMESLEFEVRSPPDRLELDLGTGAPIYGRISARGVGLPDAAVQVLDDDGTPSAEAHTDEFGLYQIRVSPGAWQLRVEPPQFGQNPAVVSEVLDVTELGVAWDFDFPSLSPAVANGEVLDSDGQPIRGAAITFVAESLTGFPDGVGTWSGGDETVSDGRFTIPVVPGIYTIEVVPPLEGNDAADQGPLRLTGIALDQGFNSLDPIVLGALVPLEGTVSANGVPVGSAYVSCAEVGFAGRRFEAFTSETGRFAMDVSDTELSCEFDPPGQDETLATAYRSVLPGKTASLEVDLPVGDLVSGRVVLEGTGEAFALVEIRSSSGRLLGAGLTTESGEFVISVDLSAAD